MSNVRSGKAIKREVFEQPQNTLISGIETADLQFHSKLEDKYEMLEELAGNSPEMVDALFVWVGVKSSHIFSINKEDAIRLLAND